MYPTTGFTSLPTSVRVSIGDGVDSILTVDSSLDVVINGSGALKLTEDQTQALFSAVGDTVKAYLLSVFPAGAIQGEVVNYVGTKSITLS